MALSTVTLKWDLTDLIQAGVQAVLSITPTAQLSDSTDHVLIPPVARRVSFFGGAGELPGIVANDNANVLPAGTGYLISVTAASGQVLVPQFQTQILTANGATQWLDALAVVPVVATSYQYLPLTTGAPADGQVPVFTGAGYATAPGTISGTGTVTSASVVSANGFAGTVENPTTTPAITLETTVTGLLKGNGTAVSAAAAGSDYLAPNGSGAALTGITASQVGADASGAAASAQTAAESYADTSKLAKSANLSDLASASTARTNLGIGSAATHASTDFDASGAAASAQSAAEAASVALAGDTMTGWLAPKVVALTDASTIAVNAALGNSGYVTLGGNRTMGAPGNPSDGQTYTFEIIQDGTGSRTLAWASGTGGYSFGSGSAPTLSTAAGATDQAAFRYSARKSEWLYLGSGLGF